MQDASKPLWVKPKEVKIDQGYKPYNIFLATDVDSYIHMVSNIFKGFKIYYNNFISRIQQDTDKNNKTIDSIINLKEFTGFKLGSDIIYDCLSLINCDIYYVSVTNIAFITSFINEKNNGLHYN